MKTTFEHQGYSLESYIQYMVHVSGNIPVYKILNGKDKNETVTATYMYLSVNKLFSWPHFGEHQNVSLNRETENNLFLRLSRIKTYKS